MKTPRSARFLRAAAPLLAALAVHHADAASSAATPQVEAELVAPVQAVYPGETVRLGLHQRIAPHWHTYWINPGDSGLPTTIAWQLPEGASAGPIEWPAPSRFATGPVSNYGYADAVTLLSAIQVPAGLAPGSRFTVGATVDWLVCKEVCIPQQVKVDLALPVIAPGSARKPGSPLVDAAIAALPRPAPWPVSIDTDGPTLRLRVPGAGQPAPTEAWFYANDWGKTAHGGHQTLHPDGDTLTLHVAAGEAPAPVGAKLSGLLVLRGIDGTQRAWQVTAPVHAAPAPLDQPTAAPTPQAADTNDGLQLGGALILALLGGLVLNLMPCVFPVLSIKALALIRHAHHHHRTQRLQGLAYAAGVLASFAALAGLLVALRAGGAAVGWGFQFQSPVFVLAVAYLMFAVGLGLSGAITLGSGAAGIGASLAERPGLAGSFFTGVLASVVATPCTAPFMGAALGFALAQPGPVLLAVFLALGLGLALPYLALTWWPALQRRLPRPGAWMERLKEALAFPMYGAAVWLVWVLGRQAGPDATAIALGGMVAIAFAAWLWQHSHGRPPLARRSSHGLALVAVALALAGGYAGLASTGASAATSTAESKQDWELYTKARFDALRAEGKPVFVNFTAAWCITCLANERVALSTDSVRAAFRQAGVTYLKGDWTHQDPQISAHLAEFGRSGVPLYLFYPAGAGSSPQVLPQLLTPGTVIAALPSPSTTKE